MRIWTYDFLWAVFQGTLRGVSLVRLSCSHNLHQRIKRSWGWAFSLNVGCCSVAQLYPTLCSPVDCSTPACPVLHHHPEIAQTHAHWVSDAIQTSHPLSPLLLLPSIFPSIRVFSYELALRIRWSKYWSFSISPSNEYSGLISFRVDWFDLLTVQGTLKILLITTIQKHQFFSAQLSL